MQLCILIIINIVAYLRLKTELEDQFDDLKFEVEATRSVTGYFEVSVNGKLVHSKKGGDGYVDSPSKLEKIVKAVEAAQ
ncbi:hypothetical protein BSL78_24036 [Apostichopus japonicus]|uniref:Selenoprotein W n=1 Tax=Stichopus japonicus TaxID=307972 RepID=A0A2G8JTM3_STIJA|nr:hypothetical protein BSL78_24036 [Apostichopus japonicus]